MIENLPSFFSLNLNDLKLILKSWGESSDHGASFFKEVYQQGRFHPQDWHFDSMKTTPSKRLVQKLLDSFSWELPKMIWSATAQDGTIKGLIEFRDKERVECVIISAQEGNRLTLCISTQVGCAMKCDFCHTGTMGLKRSLEVNEIVGQYLLCEKMMTETRHHSFGPKRTIQNIVYMGQGEPFHNFENVQKGTEIFIAEFGLGLGRSKITLSTVGLVPEIERYIKEFPEIRLAISLHGATDEIRSEIIPINRRYPLRDLMGVLKKIPLKRHVNITFEYLLLAGLNDREEDLEALIKLMDSPFYKVNLIPFNEYPGGRFKRPSEEKIQWFSQGLSDHGVFNTIRRTKGDDIHAACGQLKSFYDQMNLPLIHSQES